MPKAKGYITLTNYYERLRNPTIHATAIAWYIRQSNAEYTVVTLNTRTTAEDGTAVNDTLHVKETEAEIDEKLASAIAWMNAFGAAR